ncbi:hypothetical protein M407DRAFT_246984 [Tulasnella calospora MUT 4182]|uniref:Protein kinase domain-containing protein n=1 Tax=Tulasnella calospora MUT 4182 TaxID=1051891 RepID=A0A0C3Q1I2_9AGAM|nr:hypothetical protein M407DRAFT_246984 [Tulasnella calospora MUT 4182]
MQFESKGLLFNRATRVWTARVADDPPEHEQRPSGNTTYIVKQNWADDKRSNEGFFHQVARDIEAVPRFASMEVCEFTSSFRARFRRSKVPEVLPLVKAPEDMGANGAGRHSFQRVLLRFVFEGQGRPLSEVNDSTELLRATVQWINGLIQLDEKGIIHRDISYGNLLLPVRSGEGRQQASIIDFGLSHLKDAAKAIKEFAPSEEGEDYPAVLDSPQPHHHVTGTMPFVAHELLYAVWKSRACEHTLYHDVESVFWVLLYVCLKEHGEPMHDSWKDLLLSLTSSAVNDVVAEKHQALTMPGFYSGIGGKFGNLEGFLSGYSGIYQAREGESAQITAVKVRDLASEELRKIEASPTTGENEREH